jgi:hypothetical protein
MKSCQADAATPADSQAEQAPDHSLAGGAHLQQRRFYFNLTNGHDMFRDADGIDLRDLDEARIYAYQAISDLKVEEPGIAQTWEEWRLEITNADGHVELAIPLEWPEETNRSVH